MNRAESQLVKLLMFGSQRQPHPTSSPRRNKVPLWAVGSCGLSALDESYVTGRFRRLLPACAGTQLGLQRFAQAVKNLVGAASRRDRWEAICGVPATGSSPRRTARGIWQLSVQASQAVEARCCFADFAKLLVSQSLAKVGSLSGCFLALGKSCCASFPIRETVPNIPVAMGRGLGSCRMEATARGTLLSNVRSKTP
jgi:hypothetical protein